jgi:hypothetical protein
MTLGARLGPGAHGRAVGPLALVRYQRHPAAVHPRGCTAAFQDPFQRQEPLLSREILRHARRGTKIFPRPSARSSSASRAFSSASDLTRGTGTRNPRGGFALGGRGQQPRPAPTRPVAVSGRLSAAGSQCRAGQPVGEYRPVPGAFDVCDLASQTVVLEQVDFPGAAAYRCRGLTGCVSIRAFPRVSIRSHRDLPVHIDVRGVDVDRLSVPAEVSWRGAERMAIGQKIEQFVDPVDGGIDLLVGGSTGPRRPRTGPAWSSRTGHPAVLPDGQ